MVDLVGVLENNCNTLGWKFSYGNTANNNLLTSDLDSDLIYFLLDPVRRVKAKSEYGGQGEITFNGNFLLELILREPLLMAMPDSKDLDFVRSICCRARSLVMSMLMTKMQPEYLYIKICTHH